MTVSRQTLAMVSPPAPRDDSADHLPVSGIAGQNIICFAKDWFENPTSNNHVMKELARNNKVLWLNSISTRTPSLSSGRDLRKIFRKLISFFKGAQKVADRLWVYTPIVIPLPHSKIATAVNRWILSLTIGILRRNLGMADFQLWTFIPNAGDYVGRLGESVSVYYCTDEWSNFSYVDGPRMAEAEHRLCRSVDVVFATAKSLVEPRLKLNGNTYLARHGVDHELFGQALHSQTIVPADVAALPTPILGYYGSIHDWLDQDLLALVAERHPHWSIVLLGKIAVDVSKLQKFPNVHFLGRKDHAQLPGYCKAFSVGLIPQKINGLTIHMNPIKLREYLSAGLPVVSTALPEAAEYQPWCVAADNYEDFDRAVIQAVENDSADLRHQRSDAMSNETWRRKVLDAGVIVMRVKAAKYQGT